jgi:multicomponent Na+:H+ antiporter subunit F
MSFFDDNFLGLAGALAMGMALVGIFFALARLVLGPSLADRVVALDAIGVLSVGVIATYDIATDQPVLLDAATAVALVAFLATVAFANYLERRAADE